MEVVITREQLESFNTLSSVIPKVRPRPDEVLLLEKFRIRLCHSSHVPIVLDCCGFPSSDVIIFDYPEESKEPEKETNMEVSEKMAERSMDSEDFNSSGSPLKFEFLTLNKLQREGQWKDVTGNRTVSSMEFFKCNPLSSSTAFSLRDRILRSSLLDDKLSSLPFWLIVDAKDSMGTTLIGGQKCKNKIITSHTRCLGRHGDKSDSILKAMRMRFGKNMERRSKAKAVYNVLSKSISTYWAKRCVLAKMTLTFKWSIKCDTYLSAPPPSAIALFHFSPGWKDNRITLQERTRELEHLLSLADTLTNNSEMIWPQDEMLNATVNERVENLISDSKGMQRDNTEGGRRFIDFTESLWDILRRCTCYESLVSALKIVFDALKQCRINTILHDDNKSMMARLVRDSLSGDLLLPRLEAFTPIQMLLEIGIERFRRDMIHEFVMHGFITNEADLSAWVRASASPEDRAQALLPIHLALQTMLEVKKHLVITPHLLTNMTRSVLSKYCAERITDITKVFYETEVALIDVHPEIMQSALPQIWTNDTTYLFGGSIMAHTLTHFARQTQFEFIENKIEKEERLEEHVENAEISALTSDARKAYICTLTTTSYVDLTETVNWES